METESKLLITLSIVTSMIVIVLKTKSIIKKLVNKKGRLFL